MRARACGSRRHCYNQLLAHFQQSGAKWSKAAAYPHFIGVIRPAFPWYNEVSSRVTRNAIDDLDNAYQHFWRRVRENKPANPKAKTFRERFGYPTFKKKGEGDSFALREFAKFDVDGRSLRLERRPGRVELRQPLRFTGKTQQVTISQQADKLYASVLVETDDHDPHAPDGFAVGVDFGVKSLATLSDGTVFPANQKLKANLRRVKRRQRRLKRKVKGSNRRANARLSLAKLHKRIADQRKAVLHEGVRSPDPQLSGGLYRRFEREGHGEKPSPCPRGQRCRIRYAPAVHRVQGRVARWNGGDHRPFRAQHADVLQVSSDSRYAARPADDGVRLRQRDGPRFERGLNILNSGLNPLTPDLKRAQESGKTTVRRGADVDGAKMTTLPDSHRSARLA